MFYQKYVNFNIIIYIFLTYLSTIFDRLTENDEFEYKRHWWNNAAYDIKIAE